MKKLDNKNFKLVIGISLAVIVVMILAILKASTNENKPSGSLPSVMMNRESTGSGMAGSVAVSSLSYAEDSMGMYDQKLAADSSMPSPYPAPSTGGQTAAEAEPRIIKTADLSIGVDGVAAKTQEISTLATGRGGFVQSSTTIEDKQGYKSGHVTIRVPSAKFDDTVKAIKDLAVRVDRESINGQEVTEQYTDLEARLRSSKAQEEQYLEILAKAETVQDILAVQSYLQSIRYEIESLQGQIDSLGNQTEYSTISVTLTEEARIDIPAEKFDLVRDIKLALRYVVIIAQAALTTLIWLVIVGGAILIPLGLLGVLVVWVIRKIAARL